MFGSEVAADRTASGRVVVIGRGERHHQHLTGNLGDHQPVCWWFGRIEERVGVPDLIDFVDAVGVVFEQVSGLSVDLERIGVVQPVEIEQLTHTASVLQTDTNVE